MSAALCPSCKTEKDPSESIGGLCPVCLLLKGTCDPMISITCSECGDVNEFAYDESETYACPKCSHIIHLEEDELNEIELVDPKEKKDDQWLGRYKLVKVIGNGRYGQVWQADDVGLNRMVAIKTPLLNEVNASEHQRVAREAEAASRLNHPNIVRTLDILVLDSKIHIISDYIEGKNLQEYLTSKRVNVRQAASIISKLADAIDYSHTMGIIHRDLKPANIIVSDKQIRLVNESASNALDNRNTLMPYITDFGMSKIEDHMVTLNIDTDIVGSPAYMSPEQITDPANIDHRADIYALGCILYELLSGESPYQGKTKEVFDKIVQGDVQSLEGKVSDISKDLSAICMKCLCLKREDRYQTAKELMMDLEFWLADMPIRARKVGVSERILKWGKRKPVEFGLTAAVFLIMFITTVLIYRNWQIEKFNSAEIKKQKNLAIENLELAKKTLDECYEINKETMNESDSIHPIVEDGQKRLINFYEKLIAKSSSPKVMNEYSEKCYEYALYLFSYHNTDEKMADSMFYYNKAIELQESLRGQDSKENFYLVNWMKFNKGKADLLSYLEKNNEADPLYDKLLMLFEKHNHDKKDSFMHEELVSFHVEAGCHYVTNNSLDLSEKFLIKQIEVSKFLIAKNKKLFEAYDDLAHAYRDLGRIYMKRKIFKTSEEYFLNAISTVDKAMTVEGVHEIDLNINKSQSFEHLSRLYRKNARPKEARKYDQMSLALSKEVVSKHPNSHHFQNYIKRLTERMNRQNRNKNKKQTQNKAN